MFISSSTHGGQLFRNGQLLETKQEFGFGQIQESNIEQLYFLENTVWSASV